MAHCGRPGIFTPDGSPLRVRIPVGKTRLGKETWKRMVGDNFGHFSRQDFREYTHLSLLKCRFLDFGNNLLTFTLSEK